MKILAPVNNPKEVKEVIRAGANEIYCGVLPGNWMREYSNVASPNRREWQTANLNSFNELKGVLSIAHSSNVPVYLTLNALYTEKQYPLILEHVINARNLGVDALIIADLGLLLRLKKEKADINIHISTGGTIFNSQTAKFYEELGVSRIILPRHLRVEEIKGIVNDCPALPFEVLILNSGCKNIDGFCTFQHGVNEVLHRRIWNLPKKMNFDRHFLNVIRRLPMKLAQGIKVNIFGVDSACLLNYKISFASGSADINPEKRRKVLRDISSTFNLLYGVDSCGACRLAEFKKIGLYGVKIIGRNYSMDKKVKDVTFLKILLAHAEGQNLAKKEFYKYARKTFKQVYKINCRSLCYYPDGM